MNSRLLLVTALACALAAPLTAAQRVLPADTQPAPEDVLRANIDPSADPRTDFFQYANGGWFARNPIPASESGWGIANEITDNLRLTLRRISEQAAAANAPEGSDQQKIGDFWTIGMDEARANRLGMSPIAPELARIDQAQTLDALLDVAFAQMPIGGGGLFDFGVQQDMKASDVMAVYLSQGGLGLPERDFYFNPEAGVAKIRSEYVAHLARLLVLSGRPGTQATRDAQAVMAFETALAKASRKLEDLREPWKNYNRMTPAELRSRHAPGVDWTARIASLGLRPETVVVGQPEFFTALDGLMRSTPLDVLKDYERLQLLEAYSPYLSKPFADESFRFNGQVLSGQKAERPRWKRVLDTENRTLGMVLGRLFVKDVFPAQAKQRYVDMVEAVKRAYARRIDQLEWMSPATKQKAQAKLAAVTYKVGYPDKWKDYSSLKIGRESYAANMMAARRWNFADTISKYGKPVDRSEWGMTPQTYNAYYNPSNNEIVLPAAMLMIPGLSDRQVDDALAWGYVGASTIGHEITHGFDDEGRQFDAQGNLHEWWTKEDDTRFRAATQRMTDQFNAYEPIKGMHINGQASLGENIADYGGLRIALDAFKDTDAYKSGKLIGGFTPLQRFFLGYALGWKMQQREEVLRSRLLSDVHAPAKWRVLGPMSNLPEFQEAFGVKPGDAMYRAPAERVNIW